MISREQLRDIVSQYEQLQGRVESMIHRMHSRMMELEDIIGDIITEQEGETK